MTAAPRHTPQLTIVLVDQGDDCTPMLTTLQAQSFRDWEWLVLTQTTAATNWHRLQDVDPRVRIVDFVGAVVQGWNYALIQSSTPYLCFIAPETELAETFLEHALWVVATVPEAAVCNAYATVGSTQTAWPYGFEQGQVFLEKNLVEPPFVVRRTALDLVGSFAPDLDPSMACWDMWLRLAHAEFWGYSIRKILIGRPTATPQTVPAPGFVSKLADHRRQLIGRFPAPISLHDHTSYTILPVDPPFINEALIPHTNQHRILLLMPWLIVGGAERVNLDFARAVVAAEHKLTIVTTLPDIDHAWAATFGEVTADIFHIDQIARPIDYARFLVYLVRSRAIDVVMISNSMLGYQLLPFIRAHCPEVAVVDYCHSGDARWQNGGYPRFGAAYQQLVDLNITSSEQVRDWMVQRGADAERIAVAYTNVDTDRWTPHAITGEQTRAQYGLAADDLLIVFVGRLSIEKRTPLIADICARLYERAGTQFLCLIIGDGPERAILEARIVTCGMTERVRLLGRIDDAAIHAHLSAADVLILPSETEGISVAVFEAMAMATIPLSAAVGGQAELITPDVGFLVPHGANEVDEYAQILYHLVVHPLERARQKHAARERVVAHFPLTSFGPTMLGHIDRAIARSITDPVPHVSPALAREHTVQALELRRVERALDLMWAEHERSRNAIPGSAISRTDSVDARVRARFRTIYRFAVGRGFTFLIPVRRWFANIADRP